MPVIAGLFAKDVPDWNSYAGKAQQYLSRPVFQGTPLTGKTLASSAKKAYEKTGRIVPLELALSQAQFETSMARKGRNPKTNPFNVGEYDKGTKIRFKTLQEGVDRYYDLIANDYLPDNNYEKLLNNFVNKRGLRYASDPLYEKKLRGQVNTIRSFLNPPAKKKNPVISFNPFRIEEVEAAEPVKGRLGVIPNLFPEAPKSRVIPGLFPEQPAPRVENIPRLGAYQPQPKTPIMKAKEWLIGETEKPERKIARAQNIYAISQTANIPLEEVRKHYKELARKEEITGISGMKAETAPELAKALVGFGMTPAIVAGVLTHPLGTIGGAAIFTALDKAIPTEKFIPSNWRDDVKSTLELADFIGKAALTGGIFKKAPAVIEKFTKAKLTEFNLPKTIKLSAEQVRDIRQTGKLTTPEEVSLFGELGLTREQQRIALSKGIDISIPAEKIIKVVDKPYWEKVKSVFGLKPSAPVIRTFRAGKPALEPAGLLPAPQAAVIPPKIAEKAIIPAQQAITPIQPAIVPPEEAAKPAVSAVTVPVEAPQAKEITPVAPAVQEAPALAPIPKKERGFITSLKESEIIKPEIKDVISGEYTPITNVETYAKAKQLVEKNPQEALMKITTGEPDADYTAIALASIAKAQNEGNYEYAVKVAEITAEKLTKGGQFIQAASMLNRLSPEGILFYAQKQLAKAVPSMKLSGESAKIITEQAKLIQDLPFGYEKVKQTQELLKMIENEIPMPLRKRIGNWALELANLPRTLMSSFFDLSFGGRQGIFALPSFPKEFAGAWKAQFKMFATETGYEKAMDAVMKHPDYIFAEKSGISFTDLGYKLAKREEQFMSTLAEKLPFFIGKGVRMTSRAYTGMANKLRMDIFSSMIRDTENAGFKPRENATEAKAIANFVNTVTGRGSLGRFEKDAILLNAVFYSPRLMASRLKLLNPLSYIKANPAVRKQSLKSLFAFAGMITAVLGLAKLAGAKVGADWRNADFGKIKIRNTRIDIMGGFQQYIRMAGQLITGQYVSSTTGKVITLGEGYKPLTRLDILQRQVESKEAPILSFATDILRGTTFAGEKVNIPKEIGLRFVPMVIQDMYDLYKEDPSLLPLGGLAVFGFGAQTYSGQNKSAFTGRFKSPKFTGKFKMEINP